MLKYFIVFSTTLLLSGCSLPFSQQKAALQIETTPQATVYLNGNHVGETRYYAEKLKPGEYTVKLSVAGNAAQEWEGKVTLAPQIVTVLNRTFGPTPEESSFYQLYLEPLANKSSTQLSLVTIPENVIVKVDGQPQGFSPLVLDNLAVGNHAVSLSAAGYEELAVSIEMKEGYKLVLSANLARSSSIAAQSNLTATPSAELTLEPIDPTKEKPDNALATPTPPTVPAEIARPYIEIKDTPTGWLRVRSEPNGLADNEVARLNSGEKVPYLESSNTGWYKVEYEAGQEGWISAQYATLFK